MKPVSVPICTGYQDCRRISTTRAGRLHDRTFSDIGKNLPVRHIRLVAQVRTVAIGIRDGELLAAAARSVSRQASVVAVGGDAVPVDGVAEPGADAGGA